MKLEVSLYGSGPGGKEVLEDRKGHRDCSQPPDPLCPRTSKGTDAWLGRGVGKLRPASP